MAGRTPKIAVETWVDTARCVLIEKGIAEVKVDRLARRLGVTRGGFYNSFRDREELLVQLLELWEATCKFLPPDPPGRTFAEAGAWVEFTVDRLIEEDGYDHHFDMAVREWARSDQRAASAVERVDRQRISVIKTAFNRLGYDKKEALIRARVFYFHQIGFYAIGVSETLSQRRRKARLYVDILAGPEVMELVRAKRRKPKRPARI